MTADLGRLLLEERYGRLVDVFREASVARVQAVRRRVLNAALADRPKEDERK